MIENDDKMKRTEVMLYASEVITPLLEKNTSSSFSSI
jgi:hypothetical protein